MKTVIGICMGLIVLCLIASYEISHSFKTDVENRVNFEQNLEN